MKPGRRITSPVCPACGEVRVAVTSAGRHRFRCRKCDRERSAGSYKPAHPPKVELSLLPSDLYAEAETRDGLICGQYRVHLRQAPSGNWEVFADGAPYRSGLTREGAELVIAAYRTATCVEWK